MIKFKFLLFLSCIFLTSILFFQTILSDVVDITIEYETTTVGVTTTPTGETTTPTGDGGGSGGIVTTTTIETITEEIMLTYSMPEYFEIYQNEMGVFNIEVNNEGTLPLHNILITISGIPDGSYSISPSRISTLEPDDYSSFSVSVDPKTLTVGTHTLTITITSDEKYETTSMSLDVKGYTKEVAEQMEEQEKIEEEIKPKMIATKYLLISTVLVTGITLLNVLLGIIKRSRESIQIP